MKNSLRNVFVWLVLVMGLWTVASLTACNTMEGAGEDIGEAGEAIEDAAD